MLEIRNVTKVYHSKSGNSVRALDNISMSFPETGMVFILGKSGSGKSTLLNVIGGLDGYDSGEFVIKGKSSKDFRGSDFDAYRNTFIGFIFQEYNILDDFTVGANIGLALELQGKKATNEKITEILGQVDMLDYAKRKPNELSGGQKQRIAIARALVKDPEIIMADEPSGALDSNTGKQIFDTLKELSKTKLVIVVSHDRDFAEKYGDRIIEMKDGQILSDVTKHAVEAKPLSSGLLQMNDNLLRIEKGYQLTVADMELINEYLRRQSAEILISGDNRVNSTVRSAAGISENNTSSVFNTTDAEKDISLKDYSGTKTKFIRSRLPMKNALKIGGSSLGHKKFRLVLTILLSMIAFALFGFADTLGAYDKIVTATDSIIDSNVQNATFSLGIKHEYIYPDEEDNYHYHETVAMNDDDIKNLSSQTGIDFIPVYNGSWYTSNSFPLTSAMISTTDISSSSAYTGVMYGLSSLASQNLSELGFTVYGTMPSADNEIAISKFMAEQFDHTGFQNVEKQEKILAGNLTYTDLESENSIIGKHLPFQINGMVYTMKITAVIDTNFEYDRYANYIPSSSSQSGQSENSMGNEIIDFIMLNELQNTLHYGFHCLGFVAGNTLDTIMGSQPVWNMSTLGTQMWWNATIQSDNEEGMSIYLDHVADSSALSSFDSITWLDGKDRTQLAKNEIVLSSTFLNQISFTANVTDTVNTALRDEFGTLYDTLSTEERQYGLRSIISTLTNRESEALVSENYGNARYRLQLKKYIIDRYYSYDPGYEPNDDEYRNMMWECVYSNDPALFLPDVRKHDDAYIAHMHSILGKVYGMEFDSSLPRQFYEEMNDLWYNEHEGGFMLNQYEIRNLLIHLHAYELLWENDEFYNSEEFFNTVLAANNMSREDWDNMGDKQYAAISNYRTFLSKGEYETPNMENPFGPSFKEFNNDAFEFLMERSGSSLADRFESFHLALRDWDHETGLEKLEKKSEYKIVGLFDDPNNNYQGLIISDSFAAEYDEYKVEQNIPSEIITPHKMGHYAFAIAPMPTDRDTIRSLVELNFNSENADLHFSLENQVMDTLGSFNNFIEMGAKIFLYVGIGFAVFAALMLMNFISVSISYKRREIGILRAVGARSSDVFKIFFCEAFIIALINYVLAMAATIAATTIFNTIVRNNGINVTLLHFGVRQVALMFVISLAVAAIASFLPVWNIARRKPIDAIKNK